MPFKVIFRMSYTIHEIYFCVKKIILYNVMAANVINSRENEWNLVEFTEERTFIVPRNLTTLGLNVTDSLG